MNTYIIFYSRKEIADKQVGILKNHFSDCLIFCNMDSTNIKESYFYHNEGNNKIIICGSQNTLKNWAMQWAQACSIGYDNNAKGLIFYISVENLKALANGATSVDKTKEEICIDGYADFDECKYLCKGVVFYSTKKSLLNKIKQNTNSGHSKAIALQTHGTVRVVQKNGKSKQYIIPKPVLSSASKTLLVIAGIGIRNDGVATIQVVPECWNPPDKTEFSAMYPKGFITFNINGTRLFGDVSEIVAASETANTKKKKRTPKKENAT